MKYSVVIPAHNESENIVSVLKKLKDVLQLTSQSYEIILVNDGSTDDTAKKARDCGVKVIDRKENLGYGRSLKDGIRASSGEYIMLIDADGTYDVNKIPQMLDLIKNADMVVGKRIFSQKSTDRFKNLTRRFFVYLVGYYAGKKIEDLNSGQRIFRRKDVIDRLNIFPDGFSFTSTITVQYIIEKKTIVYMPINYIHRSKGSKFISGPNIHSIAKLAFSLTFKGRPVLFSSQLAGMLIFSGFLSTSLATTMHAGFFTKLLFFVMFYLLMFLIFLCYIYARGRSLT